MIVKIERMLFSTKKIFKRLKKKLNEEEAEDKEQYCYYFCNLLAIDTLKYYIIQIEAFYIIKL